MLTGGEAVDIYLDIFWLLNFLVDFLLLLGANRLCGYPLQWKRAAAGAAVGSVYSTACLFPGFAFLGNLLWRIVSLLGISAVAYGVSLSAFRRGVVFTLLSMALGGIALGLGHRGFAGLAASAAVLCLLCVVGFKDRPGSVSYVPVELHYGDKRLRLTALQDTGNTLTDPVTGTQVLVVAAGVAQQITGLTQKQLSTPVESVSALPGLRLVPYQTVGQTSGLLLALKLPKVKIGKWEGSRLVAFSPNSLSTDGTYQALTGGYL